MNDDSIIQKVKGVKKEVVDSKIIFELLESLLKKESKLELLKENGLGLGLMESP